MANDQRLPAVLTLAVATVLAVDAANARAYSVAASSLALSTTAGLLLVGLAVLWLRAPGDALALPRAWARWLGALAVLAGGVAIHVRGILSPGPLLVLGIVAAFGVAGMIAGTVARRVALLAAGALACGIALRVFELLVIPISPERGDMLPLVVLAVGRAVGGENPYVVYSFPWHVPLTYLPGTWLSYAPLLVSGHDPRWTNTAADLAILGAVFFAGRRSKDKTMRDAAVALWAAWFVAHRIIKDDAGVAAPVQWAAIAWMGALAVEASRWTPVVVGLALGTTTLAWPLVPTIVIAWHRARGKVSLARGVAVAAVVAAVMVLPWLLASPRGFFDGVYLWFNDLDRFPRTKWLENRAWAAHPGLAGAFWQLGLERWMKPIQLVAVAALAVRFARARAPEDGGEGRALAPELVGVFLLFLAFNPVVWGYLWEPAVALALVGVASREP